MSSPRTVRLLDAEPDLGRYLTAEDFEALAGLAVPLVEVPAGPFDLRELTAGHHAFGVIILDGMLVRRIVVGEVATLRLLGPGDVAGPTQSVSSIRVTDRGWRAAAPSRMAVLDREILMAAHRAPRLVAGLHARAVEQTERVALQLAICQLPRIEDRVLSLLWLLAESWGQVTAHGTALRLHLTHETIGGLVGGRRSTVTLALRQLTDDGVILRQERGWLLLESPPQFDTARMPAPAPELLEPLQMVQRVADATPIRTEDVTARLRRLREATEHLCRVREDAGGRLELELRRLRETQRRSVEIRAATLARRANGSAAVGLHHEDHAGDGVGPVQGEADDGAAEVLPAPVDGVEH